MSKVSKLISAINAKYGEGTLLPASKALSLVVERISTGVLALDLRIGGGLPRGRITMLKGDFSAGKSAIAMKCVAQAQRSCRFCGAPFEVTDMLGEVHELKCICGKNEPMKVVWLDAEHAFDPSWARRWGICTEDLLIIQTAYAEQGIDVSDLCIRSDECDLLVVDSIAALTPGVEIENSVQAQQMGVFARLMNKALRKWTAGMNAKGLLSQTKCTVLLINQMRVNLGGYHATPTSPGGKGLDFYESLEVRFKRLKLIEDPATKRPVGQHVEFTVKKNKTAPPSSGGAFKIFFVPSAPYHVGDTDIDVQLAEAAGFWNLIDKKGAWFTLPDGTRLQGAKSVGAYLRNNYEAAKILEEQVRAKELSWAVNGLTGDIIMVPDSDDDDEEIASFKTEPEEEQELSED